MENGRGETGYLPTTANKNQELPNLTRQDAFKAQLPTT